VNREVIHALLGLFDQRVTENLPGEVFRPAVYFLQCLVNWNGAHRDRAVADDPFAGLVNVLSGGKIHQRVAAPFHRPAHFFHFLIDGGSDRAVANVGVDLHEEVPADDHRLELRVIDVGRDDRAAAGNFAPHKFRGDFLRNTRAP